MKKTVQLIAEAMMLLMLVAGVVFAGGYQLNEQSARTTGMGGAFVARASDPSAIYFNPAGLGFQKGWDFLSGTTVAYPSSEFIGTSPSTGKTTTKWQGLTTAHVYGTCKMSPDIVVGFGIYNPFEFGIEWPDNWIGRQAAIKANLHTWYFNPSIGYKVDDQLSLGFGISYVYSTLFLSTNPRPPITEKMEFDLSGSGINFNFGVLYKPIEGLSVGVSYRMETKIEYSGEAKTSEQTLPLGTWLSSTCTTELPMPGNLTVGASYELLPELTIEADFQYVQWSEYYQLKVTIPQAQIAEALTHEQIETIITGVTIPPYLMGNEVLTSNKKWDDEFIGRLGIEYQYDEDLTVRGGFIYDFTPVPSSTMDPVNPDANKINLTAGAGYKLNQQIYVDVAYMVGFYSDKTSYTFPQGTYKSIAHFVSVNVGYSF